MIKKLDHAKHNESVCNFISQKQDYADWVVITAFYSAMHFVDHKIFPLKTQTDNGQKFSIDTLDQCYLAFNQNGKSKHALREDLVKTHCNLIAASFNWLNTACRTARYTNYKFDKPRDTSTKAKEHLTAIKKFCDNSKVENIDKSKPVK